jgi:hypothetical protein
MPLAWAMTPVYSSGARLIWCRPRISSALMNRSVCMRINYRAKSLRGRRGFVSLTVNAIALTRIMAQASPMTNCWVAS